VSGCTRARPLCCCYHYPCSRRSSVCRRWGAGRPQAGPAPRRHCSMPWPYFSASRPSRRERRRPAAPRGAAVAAPLPSTVLLVSTSPPPHHRTPPPAASRANQGRCAHHLEVGALAEVGALVCRQGSRGRSNALAVPNPIQTNQIISESSIWLASIHRSVNNQLIDGDS
jgi:hypothetical protein